MSAREREGERGGESERQSAHCWSCEYLSSVLSENGQGGADPYRFRCRVCSGMLKARVLSRYWDDEGYVYLPPGRRVCVTAVFV